MRKFWLLVSLLLLGGTSWSAEAQGELTLTSPVAFQVVQRHNGTGNIPIAGSASAAGTVEARFNSGAWQAIATVSGGTFAGSLASQPQGQGSVEVRLAETPDVIVSVAPVGIGDVFIVAGQSNASGRGTNPQPVSHPALKAGVFGNDYVWHELTDPVDSNANRLDEVSIDLEAAGSVWTLVATQLMNARNVPVAFVPAARGGSSISDWLPGSDRFNRATLYGSMAFRARLTGARAILWWQGETDALEGMSGEVYGAQFRQFADAVGADLGIPVIASLIHNSMGIPDDAEAVVRRAVVDAAGGNGNIWLGPDLSDLASDDPYHLQSDANLQTAANRWWQALNGYVE